MNDELFDVHAQRPESNVLDLKKNASILKGIRKMQVDSCYKIRLALL